jgi:DTW domain-containing protein YfiP
MSRRDSAARRCPTCRLHQALCICALTPKLETKTRLVLVIHRDEERKPTNTGLLAVRSMPDTSRVVITGDHERPIALPVLRDDEQGVLLFPDDEAVPIERFARADKPIALVVPDGTWNQAKKVRHRVPGLEDLPRVKLPEGGAATAYKLRNETKDGGLATLEAIARALRVLEGERGAHVEEELLKIFRIMRDRTLWMRGALPTKDVEGGIPDEAHRIRG